MLIGFTIVAAPLLFAIVNAAVQMNRLSIRSQQLVVHGMQGTRNNQRMFEEIGALERTRACIRSSAARTCCDAYAQHHARLITATHELLTLPLDETSQEGVRAVRIAKRINCCRSCGMRRPNSQPHGRGDRRLSAALGGGIQRLRSDQPADRSGNGEPGSWRRSARRRICFGKRCCSCR